MIFQLMSNFTAVDNIVQVTQGIRLEKYAQKFILPILSPNLKIVRMKFFFYEGRYTILTISTWYKTKSLLTSYYVCRYA